MCKKATCEKPARENFVPGPILTTRMLPTSPCPFRNVDESKNSGKYFGSNSSTCLYTSHIASGDAARSTSVCDSVLHDKTARSRVLNMWTISCLMCSGGPHVSDRLVRCGPDCLTAGVTHGDKFYLGAVRRSYSGDRPPMRWCSRSLLASSILSMRSFISPT